jgi:hypothetical protein
MNGPRYILDNTIKMIDLGRTNRDENAMEAQNGHKFD